MEIEREENIFYNLIKNETSLTEVFCNFMRYKIFRDLFIDIVNEKIKHIENKIDKSKLKFQDFDTEIDLKKEINNYGRIDLQLKINDKIYLFEIKVETFTKLTDNQPKNYLEYLENRNENLFFILPKSYFHKNEIFKNWENKTEYQKEDIKNHNIIYWEDILDQLKKQEIDKANIFINEFCKILDFRWFYFEEIIFTKNELDLIFSNKKEKGYKMTENVNVPVLMNKLFTIIFDTKVDFRNNKEQDPDYFGYYVDNKKYEISDRLTIWLGVDYELWYKTNTPISIQVLSSTHNDKEIEYIENFLDNKKINEISFEKYKNKYNTVFFYIKLEKEFFESEDKKIIKELTNIMNEIIELLKEFR